MTKHENDVENFIDRDRFDVNRLEIKCFNKQDFINTEHKLQ